MPVPCSSKSTLILRNMSELRMTNGSDGFDRHGELKNDFIVLMQRKGNYLQWLP